MDEVQCAQAVFPPAFSPAFASPPSASVCRPSLRHASAREGVCACVRRSAGSHTEASRICACLQGLTHLRKEIVCGLARLCVRRPKRLSAGSRVCACVDQRDCLRARAPKPHTSAHAWTKECWLLTRPYRTCGLERGCAFCYSCFLLILCLFMLPLLLICLLLCFPFCFASAYFAFFSSSLSATPFSASASPPPSSSSVSATPFSASASPPSPSPSSPPAFLHLLLLLLSLSHAPSQFKSSY